MKKILSVLLFFFLCLVVKAETPSSYLISYQKVRSYSYADLEKRWKENHVPKMIAPINYGVDVYEIIYWGKWIDSTYIKASGFYYVPHEMNEKGAMMVFHHGTQLEKAFNVSESDGQQAICTGMAADGYYTLMPHYYGLGKGEKDHLYQHAQTEAYSTIYMLYAIDELNKKLGFHTNEKLFLTGYSQGGHATMAAHKYLQELNDPRFQVTASAPLSGAYDMSGAQAEVMFKPYEYPFYLPYLLVSYQAAYKIWPGDIYEVFKKPYDTIIPPYFQGDRRSLYDFNKVLPVIPADMVMDSLVNEFKINPNFLATKAIKINDLTDWKPKSPVLLCYTEGDEQVYFKNSLVAYDKMKENGAKHLKIKRVSKVLDHFQAAMFAVLDAKMFFDSIRDGSPNGHKGPVFKRMFVNIYKKTVEKKFVKDKEEKARQLANK